eukprot:2182938-Amphidinium_carterae.2
MLAAKVTGGNQPKLFNTRASVAEPEAISFQETVPLQPTGLTPHIVVISSQEEPIRLLVGLRLGSDTLALRRYPR